MRRNSIRPKEQHFYKYHSVHVEWDSSVPQGSKMSDWLNSYSLFLLFSFYFSSLFFNVTLYRWYKVKLVWNQKLLIIIQCSLYRYLLTNPNNYYLPIGQWLAVRIYSKVCKYNSDVKMSLQAKYEFTYDFGVLFFTEVKWGGTLVLLSNCTNKENKI